MALVAGRSYSTLTHPILCKKVPIKKRRKHCSASVPPLVVVQGTGRQEGSFAEVVDRRTGFAAKAYETDKPCGEKSFSSSQSTTGVYFENVELGSTSHPLQLGRAKLNSNDLPLGSVIGRPLLPAPLLPKGLAIRRAVKVATVIGSHCSQKVSSLSFQRNGFKKPVPISHFMGQQSSKDMSDDEKLFVEAAAALSSLNDEAPKTRSAMSLDVHSN